MSGLDARTEVRNDRKVSNQTSDSVRSHNYKGYMDYRGYILNNFY